MNIKKFISELKEKRAVLTSERDSHMKTVELLDRQIQEFDITISVLGKKFGVDEKVVLSSSHPPGKTLKKERKSPKARNPKSVDFYTNQTLAKALAPHIGKIPSRCYVPVLVREYNKTVPLAENILPLPHEQNRKVFRWPSSALFKISGFYPSYKKAMNEKQKQKGFNMVKIKKEKRAASHA